VPEPEAPEPEVLPFEPVPVPEPPSLEPPSPIEPAPELPVLPAPIPEELLRVVLLEPLVSGVLAPAPEVPVPDMRPLLQPATSMAARPRLSNTAGRAAGWIVDLKVMCLTS
jgi:hypothetical protein